MPVALTGDMPVYLVNLTFRALILCYCWVLTTIYHYFATALALNVKISMLMFKRMVWLRLIKLRVEGIFDFNGLAGLWHKWKTVVMSSNRLNRGSQACSCHSKDKCPSFLRVKVRICQDEQSFGAVWCVPPFQNSVKNVGCKELLSVRVSSNPSLNQIVRFKVLKV